MEIKDRILRCMENSGIVVLEDGTFGDISSIEFISAILELESEFDIEFPDQYLIMDLFRNMDNILMIIERIINDKNEQE